MQKKIHKNIFFLLLFVFSFSTFNTIAQERWSVTAGFGTASGGGPIDGYFVSFDIGIPITEWLSLAPTVNFVSTIPTNHIDNHWNKDFSGSSAFFEGEQEKQYYGGDLLGSVNLILLFKPFSLINNPSFEKHELALGAGYGLKSYAGMSSYYQINNGGYELARFNSESNVSIEPIYGKIFYNYHFSDKFFAGITATLDGFDGEGVALFGLQIGMNFTTRTAE